MRDMLSAKKYILLFCVLISFQISYAQNNFQTRNLATFCKVWGFLKYYHPATSKHSINWDTVLTNNYPKVKNAQSKGEFNRILLSITQKLGELKPTTQSFNPSDSEAVNTDFKWMDDTTVLSSSICNYLRRVKTNHRPFRNKYIGTNWDDDTKVKENSYPEMVYPNEAYRFLALARYWNIINYYFPDKYLTELDWNSSLEKAIPIFIDATNQEDYYRAIEWITAKTNDSHATTVRNPYISYSDYKYPPFAAYYSHDTLIVVNTSGDSIGAIFNIHKGDAIIAVDGKPVKDLWQDICDHHSASNEGYMEYFYGLSFNMTRSKNDSTGLTIIRAGKQIETWVKNYSTKELITLNRHTYHAPKPINSFSIKMDTVSGKKYGYISMGILKRKEINRIFRQMKGIDYLVIDNRSYPSSNIHAKLGRKLVAGRKYIASYSQPDYGHPGYIRFHRHPYIAFLTRKIGTKNKYYKGKVIILVDHSTQSSAEYLTMILRLAPAATVIGSQTAGADGNTSIIVFPGNYSVRFTGLGWFYADGRQTQRIGIVPDIKVGYTVCDELNHTDPIMQRALEYIRTSH